MKKIILTTLTIITLISCQSDDKYEDKNRDPKNPTQVSSEFLFNAATKSLFDQMTSTNVNNNIYRMLGQHWTETTYVDEANYDFNTRNITQSHWSEIYRDVLADLATAKINNDADLTISAETKKTKNAQIEILTVYAWAQMVETFGDIPYSQALNAGQYVLPVYDDAATIYSDLLTRIAVAIPNLTDSGFGTADKIYGGDTAKWKKFGNSLMLRMGVRVADVPALATKSTAAIKAAVSGGVFTSNADNASLVYSNATPNTNPVWVDLVQSGRSDFVIANTLVDFMNNLSDPRRAVYFDQNLGTGVYEGGPYGDNNAFSSYTHVSDRVIDPTNPASLIDYSEVCFYLADAAERSISGTPVNAALFYNAGITASFDYWGAPNVATYLANPAVNYATAPGTWKVKIGNQLWLAMYNRGYEAWTAWRTYDMPGFNLPAVSEDPVPTRYTYPISEQNLNKVNYTAASAAIGGDTQTTKVFWDKF
ncbi:MULTISPECIES: SusD/RagB family nutrient-binding outer membrane lipoprotein [unclassified Flavobacterium]|uniref:SusD/RagB family nutrient-binding outer membrane lipoprotein n=1 Tax=unclassified Flavobacterium TaxID=196869 RepID=UPI000C1A299B|nr:MULTISPECIES: SusD/RagB family nutrient-binding outer membrane lipoprotein [unclassified Flavobacterium]PIF60731.1 SusD-like starch-binding protein associating with outer membrane [Flavobacterium sp. 11]WKL45108.1 SusD/RagB family nutrient-binding outer membrane lipoprotein [Flavobacterium sp. ZE23DGlu08]